MKLKKLNIMKTRPEISDEEIRSMMDFDKVLQQHTIANRFKYLSIVIGSVVVIALIIGWAFLYPRTESTAKEPEVATPRATQPAVKSEPKPIQQEKKVATKPVVVPAKPEQEQTQQEIKQENVYAEALPVNGYENLYAYFERELKYPSDATVAAEGDVSVTFVINSKGKPEQIKFINSLGPEFDKEVIRVINNMPEWRPATQNGKPVPAKISQSFTFTIKK